MEDRQFNDLIKKLDLMTQLLWFSVAKDKTIKEQTRLLTSISLKPKEIAKLTGTTPATISQILYELRKEKSKRES